MHKSADAKEEDIHLADEKLTQAKQPVTLRDLTIRPSITGKKTTGELQTHCNGFRFLSSKGQKIEFTFSNINHAFFQPCEDRDIIVLIHFRLKAPIMIGQKKFLDI
jgi:nucleosome binding factor SPN SPT16 subunit